MNMQNKQMDDNAKQLGYGLGCGESWELGGHSGKCYAE